MKEEKEDPFYKKIMTTSINARLENTLQNWREIIEKIETAANSGAFSCETHAYPPNVTTLRNMGFTVDLLRNSTSLSPVCIRWGNKNVSDFV